MAKITLSVGGAKRNIETSISVTMSNKTKSDIPWDKISTIGGLIISLLFLLFGGRIASFQYGGVTIDLPTPTIPSLSPPIEPNPTNPTSGRSPDVTIEPIIDNQLGIKADLVSTVQTLEQVEMQALLDSDPSRFQQILIGEALEKYSKTFSLLQQQKLYGTTTDRKSVV